MVWDVHFANVRMNIPWKDANYEPYIMVAFLYCVHLIWIWVFILSLSVFSLFISVFSVFISVWLPGALWLVYTSSLVPCVLIEKSTLRRCMYLCKCCIMVPHYLCSKPRVKRRTIYVFLGASITKLSAPKRYVKVLTLEELFPGMIAGFEGYLLQFQ